MRKCEQAEGLSVLEHGQSVFDYYQELKMHIISGLPLRYSWRIPSWILQQGLWLKCMDDRIMEEYMVFHDCGKPYCRTVDEQGRPHYPGHAVLSEQIWLSTGGCCVAARLMGMDMDIHLLKADGLSEFAERPEAASLLIAGFCEIHSNAAMFGGIESISFKSKWKHIDRRGKQLVKMIT